MKIWILTISILSGAGIWHWAVRRHPARYPRGLSGKMKLAGHSIVAGAVVYFALLFVALGYLNWQS